MASAFWLTSSYDRRSKCDSIEPRSRLVNSGLMSFSKPGVVELTTLLRRLAVVFEAAPAEGIGDPVARRVVRVGARSWLVQARGGRDPRRAAKSFEDERDLVDVAPAPVLAGFE